MKSKFKEVVDDIVKKMDELNYNDIEKKIIKVDLMLHLCHMCEEENIYNKNINTLKLTKNNPRNYRNI